MCLLFIKKMLQSLFQILEDVCLKHDFNAKDYDLKHHKKILDTNMTLRFSGLPNNALLEMLATTKPRVLSEVTIGIHFEDGNRVLGTFTPNYTLYDVLAKLSPLDLNPDRNCVIIYMRREIYGIDNFQRINLISLGLTSGRAMFRVIHR